MSEETALFVCDPEKNTECTKESCYINGGECHHTTHKEYAEEQPSVAKEE